MKLAVSNIAWARDEDDAIAAVLRLRGAGGIEVAPTLEWATPISATAAEIRAVHDRWADRQLPIVACQSLLYGRDDLLIFGDAAARHRTQEYLIAMIEVGAGMGATVLVFGSPRVRRLGGMSQREARRIAIPFFARVGDAAHAAGVTLCIEPNPPQYGCEFLPTTASCVEFLEEVDTPGLGLHLDSGALTLNDEPLRPSFETARPWIRHFHISEPYLAPIGSAGVAHRQMAEALHGIGYSGWVSIEMRAGSDGSNVATVSHAVDTALTEYELVLRP